MLIFAVAGIIAQQVHVDAHLFYHENRVVYM